MTPRAQFTRLLWKEYRQVRAFGFLLLGCGVALHLVALPTTPNLAIFTYLALVLSILFAVATSAIAFSAEHENGTFLFQRVLPTNLRNIAAAKVSVAAFGAIAIFLSLWFFTFIEWRITGRRWESSPPIDYGIAEGLLILAEFLIFGTLFSLIERRALVSLAKAVAVIFAVRGLGYFLDGIDVREIGTGIDIPWPSLSVRLISVTLGMAFIYRLVKTWYADESDHVRPPASQLLEPLLVSTLRSSGSSRPGAIRRMLWLQYRASAWPIAAFVIAGSLWATPNSLPRWEMSIVFVIALMLIGAIAFRATNQNRQVLATIGASPGTIWCTQLFFPIIGGILILVPFAAYYVLRWRDNRESQQYQDFLFTGLFLGLSALCWGQLASLRCKSAFAAFGYSAALLVPACLWVACAMGAKAPFSLFVFPVIVYPLIESVIRARRIFLEDSRLGIWWFVRVGLYLSLALGLIAYRYYEIPGVSQHELNRALSIVPRMNEAQTARFRVLADALMDREAFEPTDVHNQFEIEQALRNNQYRWVANHRTVVDEIIDGPYLTSQFQTDHSANEADRMRFATINEFTLAAFETTLDEGDVDLGERIIRKIPINVSPTDTLRWCRLPMNDSKRIRRLAHQLQDASIFDRECRRVLLRQWLLPNLNEAWGEYYQWSIDHTSNLLEAAWLFIATDGFRWKRRTRFFTVEAARQLEAILPGFPFEDEFARLRELNRAKDPNAAPAKQITDEDLPAIHALSVYSGVLGKLGGMSLQLAVVSWQMDHAGRLPDSLDELTIEYMPKLRFDPNGGANFIYEKDRHFAGEEIVVPGAKNYFVFVFGGGTRRIEVPFKVSTGIQSMRDSEGRLPPMIFSSKALKVQAFQINTASWSIAGDTGQIFPLDLPADEVANEK